MPSYAIGDIQGCHDDLQRMLEHLRFDPAQDKICFVGDLVNRGPDSLATLRLIKSLGDAAITVLGNHDLHLLAIACGNGKKKSGNSLDAILQATDRDELIHWLRHRPLLHHDSENDFYIIHAGLPPQWDMPLAQQCAREVEDVLRDEQRYVAYFSQMYGNKPKRWDPALEGMQRWRFITNCLTRLRFCTLDGKLGLKQKGVVGSQKKGYIPWYSHPQRKTRDDKIIFGHWSLVGYQAIANTWAIDSGCLWGGELTVLRIDTDPPQVIQQQCQRQVAPYRLGG